MKQVLQNMGTGETIVAEAPAPTVLPGHLIIKTKLTLISAGTERMLVEFGKSSLVEKARQQPDKVRATLDKARTDGVVATIEAVRSKLAEPLPLGYCNVGVVHAIGTGAHGYSVGDRVVSNGPHADIVRVPANLCCRLPALVSDEQASFVVIASIGLQGIRLAKPTLGESFVVIGAGLIGLLTIQILIAHGCRVLAVDLDEAKLRLAASFGAETCNPSTGEDPVVAGLAYSHGRGVDGVIVTASTKSDLPITQAARMSRKRGRIVLVGVAGLHLNRADFYEKELSFQVSCSYGPGRYDDTYERDGHDYPFGFVRWTEQRNFEAIVGLLAVGRLNIDSLISHRFDFESAPKAYQTLSESPGSLGILLRYDSPDSTRLLDHVSLAPNIRFDTGQPVLGVIGAGNYASRVLIPALKSAGLQLHTIVTTGGISGAIQGKKAGFAEASTDVSAILKNSTINTAVIVTRHDTHASLVAEALEAGKHVFVEKPLAIDEEGLAQVKSAYNKNLESGSGLQLMVGFNRRFAPLVARMKSLLTGISAPKAFIMVMNAGSIPLNHWTQSKEVGGGRLIGEACHMIDLMRYLVDAPITEVQAQGLTEAGMATISEDKACITLKFADGSMGTIMYLANGSSQFPKERIEVFCSGGILQLDNYRVLKGFGWPNFRSEKVWRQDKGQASCAKAFGDAVKTGKPAIPVSDIFEVAEVTLKAASLLRAG